MSLCLKSRLCRNTPVHGKAPSTIKILGLSYEAMDHVLALPTTGTRHDTWKDWREVNAGTANSWHVAYYPVVEQRLALATARKRRDPVAPLGRSAKTMGVPSDPANPSDMRQGRKHSSEPANGGVSGELRASSGATTAAVWRLMVG